ncbi:MAG: HD domain-containing protein [Solirubrobacteraceae bacterium MAG38_C4-C5]|nr:HD domain-containing protein [Candidatus Siliceabacter maunaloa]
MSEKYAETPILTERFDRAMQLALDHHRMHLRKGTALPYVTHLLAVTATVLEMGGNEDEAIAALLHDAVEDGGGPMMQTRITWQFGPAVGEIVAANSDTEVEPKPPWKGRKQQYLDSMKDKSAGALRVSLGDKLHNARSILADHTAVGDAVWSRFSASAGQTAWYYRSLAQEFEAQAARMGPGAAASIQTLRDLAQDVVAAAEGAK